MYIYIFIFQCMNEWTTRKCKGVFLFIPIYTTHVTFLPSTSECRLWNISYTARLISLISQTCVYELGSLHACLQGKVGMPRCACRSDLHWQGTVELLHNSALLLPLCQQEFKFSPQLTSLWHPVQGLPVCWSLPFKACSISREANPTHIHAPNLFTHGMDEWMNEWMNVAYRHIDNISAISQRSWSYIHVIGDCTQAVG